MRSLVVLAPVPLWPSVVAMNQSLGYEAGEGVPLSSDGTEPATYRGLHTWVGADFVAIAFGQYTPNVEGYTEQQIQGLVSQLHVYSGVVVDDVELTSRALFDHALDDLGLQTIAAELP